MKKIKLYNRDGADLCLRRIRELKPNVWEWRFSVDPKHKWILEYIRIIGNFPLNIEAVDPSGGPFISVGDEFENKYKIIKIVGPTVFWISERIDDL